MAAHRIGARLSGLFLALAWAEDCADGGPFKCTDDAGCPSPEVSCAQLAALKQCGSRFDQIFDRPPATAHPRVSEACPVACGSCGSGGPAAGAGPSRTTAGRVARPRASSGTRSSTRSLKITAPAGSHGGHLLLVETAGSVIKVDVPAGVRAGEAFDVPVLAELWSERPVARLALDGGPVASGDGYKSPARKPKQARLAGAGRGGQSFSARRWLEAPVVVAVGAPRRRREQSAAPMPRSAARRRRRGWRGGARQGRAAGRGPRGPPAVPGAVVPRRWWIRRKARAAHDHQRPSQRRRRRRARCTACPPSSCGRCSSGPG